MKSKFQSGLNVLFLIIFLIILFSNRTSAQTAGGYSIFHETMVDMTWQEVERAAAEDAIILLPIAVIEEHGPHMSCGIDTYLGYLISKLVRRELESRGVKTLIAPPFYWGVNSATHVFPGTFATNPETVKALLHDIYASLKSWGFKKVFNFITHGDGGHWRAVIEGLIKDRQDLDMELYVVISEDEAKRTGLNESVPFIVVQKSDPFEEPEFMDIHAGAFETALVAAYFPELVDEKVARTLKPTRLKRADAGRWLQDAKTVTPLGYFGDPAGFDVEWGKKYLETHCKYAATAIEKKIKSK